MGLTRSKPDVVWAAPMIWSDTVASPITTLSRNAMPWTPPAPYPTLKVELMLYSLSVQQELRRDSGAHTSLCWNPQCKDSLPRPIE